MNCVTRYFVKVFSEKGISSFSSLMLALMGGKPVSLNIGNRKFFFRPYTMDVVAMAEDFLFKQYRIPDGLSVSTAVDVGAHI